MSSIPRVVLLPLATAGVQAAAPQVKSRAPGHYRMMLGDFEITALSDGTVDLVAGKLLKEYQAGQVLRALQHAYLGTPLETLVNGYLVNTGTASLFAPPWASC